ncbi:MAG: hypothetical protein M3025_08325, partial [Actinomycetota bacterium]|nr:hypothetical protein [Actinomycetota bacterium]
MLEQTLEPPRLEVPERPSPGDQARPNPAIGQIIRFRWVLGAIGLLIGSLGLILWTGTRPGYDPYGWLV